MFSSLSIGLLIAILAVFLLLSANFESLPLALSVLSTLPAVLVGVLAALWMTHTTLNIESFMGTIMAIGVAVANAILLVTFAERRRLEQGDSIHAVIEGATSRLRPILMTSGSMLVGMIPMASGLGEGGQQTAPLGRAVIGGLSASTLATLLLLPLAFAWIRSRAPKKSASLHPDDAVKT
jgi:multidrug efflux pump subunit AcrB